MVGLRKATKDLSPDRDLITESHEYGAKLPATWPDMNGFLASVRRFSDTLTLLT
jgi:hypothetical protein